MVTIQFLKRQGNYIKGEIISISNNEAHALIDGELAEIYHEKQLKNYSNKMMTSKRTKNGRTRAN